MNSHAPSLIGFWIETTGRRYWVEVTRDRTLVAAQIEVAPHDKPPSRRRVTNKVTLARLQALVRPASASPQADDIKRLGDAVDHLMAGLRQISRRPAQESAWIAAVYLDEAKKRYGVSIT